MHTCLSLSLSLSFLSLSLSLSLSLFLSLSLSLSLSFPFHVPDVIFFIFLYQRWVYRVDHTRVNEFGVSGDDLTSAPEAAQEGGETPAIAAPEEVKEESETEQVETSEEPHEPKSESEKKND